MEYSEQEQQSIAEYLSHYPGRALQRFKQLEDYLDKRRTTEEWLYSAFVRAGGKPATQSPFYFILGKNEQLRQDFGVDAKAIQLDTNYINCHCISFTLGDSIGLYFSSASKQIYLLNQVKDILVNTNYVQEQMEPLQNYHQYIEAQLWDRSFLKKAMIIRNYPVFNSYCNTIHRAKPVCLKIFIKIYVFCYRRIIRKGCQKQINQHNIMTEKFTILFILTYLAMNLNKLLIKCYQNMLL